MGPGGISFAAVSFSRTGPPSVEDTASAIERIAAAHRSAVLEIALGGDPFVGRVDDDALRGFRGTRRELPLQVAGEPRLTPCARRTASRIDGAGRACHDFL